MYQLVVQDEDEQEQGHAPKRQHVLQHLVQRMDSQKKSLPSSMPMFYVADLTGIVAVMVPEALVEAWLPFLMATELGSVKYTFSGLSFENATGGKELYDSMPLQFDTPIGYQLPISPAILVVTPSSSFRVMSSVCDLDSTHADSSHIPLGAGALSQLLSAREGLVDVLGKGAAPGNIKSPSRATVLVHVEYIASAPSASWSEDPYDLQLLLCVRDESLAPANAHNALLLINDHFKMLSCAALLKVGDCLLVRDAIVCLPSHHRFSLRLVLFFARRACPAPALLAFDRHRAYHVRMCRIACT